MAKGRTNQPLVIEVAIRWHDHPAIKELRAAGHEIRNLGDTMNNYSREPDWIMHPAAGWHDVFFEKNDKGEYPFVQARLKAERARKKAGR